MLISNLSRFLEFKLTLLVELSSRSLNCNKKYAPDAILGNQMTGNIVKSKIVALFILGGALSGCAESSSEISPAFVSPLQYENLSCAQIQAEAQRVSSRTTQAMGAQNTAATNDQATMAVTMILFWPAAFLLNGNDETRAEVARLKGELEALEQVNIMKNCGIEFQRQVMP